jgi:hypothetical protein
MDVLIKKFNLSCGAEKFMMDLCAILVLYCIEMRPDTQHLK